MTIQATVFKAAFGCEPDIIVTIPNGSMASDAGDVRRVSHMLGDDSWFIADDNGGAAGGDTPAAALAAYRVATAGLPEGWERADDGDEPCRWFGPDGAVVYIDGTDIVGSRFDKFSGTTLPIRIPPQVAAAALRYLAERELAGMGTT